MRHIIGIIHQLRDPLESYYQSSLSHFLPQYFRLRPPRCIYRDLGCASGIQGSRMGTSKGFFPHTFTFASDLALAQFIIFSIFFGIIYLILIQSKAPVWPPCRRSTPYMRKQGRTRTHTRLRAQWGWPSPGSEQSNTTTLLWCSVICLKPKLCHSSSLVW